MLDFRGQKPIDYLKIEVFEEEITEDAFHWQDSWANKDGKWVKSKSIVDWKKNYIFLLGGLCGIESEPFESERQGKYSFVSKANLYRVLPSGARERASKSYEYDAEIRAEEVILKNEIKFMEYQAKKESGSLTSKDREVTNKYESEAKKKLAVIENAKFGRQKADSGAHKRAIIAMLKLPSPDASLVGVKVFCYKCSPDFTSAEVRQKYLSGGDPSGSVFGGHMIEHKDIETIEPEETIQEVEVNIEVLRENLKEHSSLYKLSGIILERKFCMEEFLAYMIGYVESNDKVDTVCGWLNRLGIKVSGQTKEAKMAFLKNWGK